MSHFKLSLKPAGIIPRDTGVTLQMKDIQAPAPEIEAAAPTLHMDAGVLPWGENRFGSIVVWTNDVQQLDLDVTLTVDDDTVLTIFDSVTSTFIGTTVVTIPAGSSSVHVLTHTPLEDASSTTILASAAGYSPVTQDFNTACSHLLEGVHYSVVSLSASGSNRQVSDNIHNSMTLTNKHGAFIAGWLNITDMCAEDTITWSVTGTMGGNIGLSIDASHGTPLQINILALGGLLGGTDYVSGATIQVQCLLNGTPIDNTLLGTYTFTFA